VVADFLAFEGGLRPVVDVLPLAASARPKVRTRRRNAVGRWNLDVFHPAFDVAFLFADAYYGADVSGRSTRDQQGLSFGRFSHANTPGPGPFNSN
jgi:hypothetical protein